MKIKVGDLVAGFHMGKYYLGMISRLHDIRPGVGLIGFNAIAYPHAVTWFPANWNGREESCFLREELETLLSLRRQYLEWQARNFK